MDPDDLTSILSALAFKLDASPARDIEWADYTGSTLRVGYIDKHGEPSELELEVKIIS